MGLQNLKERPQFDLEIELSGDDITSYFQGYNFLAEGTLVTFGDNLVELIENAEIGTQDQDGGCGPTIRLIDVSEVRMKYYARLIRDRMEAQHDRR